MNVRLFTKLPFLPTFLPVVVSHTSFLFRTPLALFFSLFSPPCSWLISPLLLFTSSAVMTGPGGSLHGDLSLSITAGLVHSFTQQRTATSTAVSTTRVTPANNPIISTSLLSPTIGPGSSTTLTPSTHPSHHFQALHSITTLSFTGMNPCILMVSGLNSAVV